MFVQFDTPLPIILHSTHFNIILVNCSGELPLRVCVTDKYCEQFETQWFAMCQIIQ